MPKFILVENALNIYDERLWYYIPGYNGYEISSDGYIRSMKHYRKYPFGILIQPKKRKGKVINPQDPIFVLTNNQNERVDIPLSHIIKLAKSNEYTITGYPRRTYQTDIAPRNQRYFIKNKANSQQADKTITKSPKFTIIRDTEVICPIESINGGENEWRRKL